MPIHTAPLELALGCGALGVVLMFKAFRRYFRAQKVADTSACPTASIAAGFGEAQGIAWGLNTTPDSQGHPAVFLEQYIEEYVKHGKSGSWVVRAQFSSHAHGGFFYLFDKSGLAKIFPKNAQSNILERTCRWHKLSAANATRVLENVGGKVSPSAGIFGISNWRLREKRILLANPVLVQGNFVPYATPETIASPALSFLKSKLGNFLNPMSRAKLPFDFNRDGKVDENEMRVGMSGLLGLAKKFEQNITTPNNGHTHGVFGDFSHHAQHQLYFADAHQDALLKRIGNWNALMFVAGACLIGATLYLLSH